MPWTADSHDHLEIIAAFKWRVEISVLAHTAFAQPQPTQATSALTVAL